MTAQVMKNKLKATASIKAPSGLIIVIAAYTITWFIFRILPLGGVLVVEAEQAVNKLNKDFLKNS